MASSILTPNPTTAFQSASAAPKLIRASKTFTGAANLGATGVNELFTTTGAVAVDGFWWRCTTDLVDSVDGAEFIIGVTGFTSLFYSSADLPIDLDNIDAGVVSNAWSSIATGAGGSLIASQTDAMVSPIVVANIIMTISVQNITGGVLEFYVLYRPLSADGALTLGAGMVAI